MAPLPVLRDVTVLEPFVAARTRVRDVIPGFELFSAFALSLLSAPAAAELELVLACA